MTYGVTTDGFNRKRLPEIIDEIKAAIVAEFDALGIPVTTDDDSNIGHLIGILAEPIDSLWELAEAVYNAFTVAGAEGAPLSHLCELIGISRLTATPSESYCICRGDDTTVIPASSQISTTVTGDLFENAAAITIDKADCLEFKVTINNVLVGWTYDITINGTPFQYTAQGGDDELAILTALGALIDAGAEPVHVESIDASTPFMVVEADDYFTEAGEPDPFTVLIDARQTFTYVGTPGLFTAVDDGPILAPANTLIEIETPVSGWLSVYNPLDAVKGRYDETDTAIRQRRLQSLQVAGAGTVESIRAKLLEVDGVTKATVIENTTGEVDADGRPGHSIECVVEGGDENDIAEAIWLAKPASIQTFGNAGTIVSVDVDDSQSISHTINFSRPELIYIWMKITITPYDEESLPTDFESLIKAAVVDYGDTLVAGNDVLLQRFIGPINDAVIGIKRLVIEVAEGNATPPAPLAGAYSTDDLTVDIAQQASFDTSRVSILT